MRILVTGSSGFLGQALIPRLLQNGHFVIGIDPTPSNWTQIVGTIEDRRLVKTVLQEHRLQAIIHTGALHKPNIKTRSKADFVSVNVQGTLNLLEEAVTHGIESFIFTSTTSLMISTEIRAGKEGGAKEAIWITEDLSPLQPRNIYGVTKLAAEHICKLFHQQHGLPVIILRTARFFPEEDDQAHRIVQSGPNTKVNELLFRRLTVEDACDAHIAALRKASEIGFDIFIISARTPFKREDCHSLIQNAPAVVEQYFPRYRSIYSRLGWTMFDTIDRVYDSSKAEKKLGFVCKTDFAANLAALRSQIDDEEPEDGE